MQLLNNAERYGLVNKAFHWTMFVMILFLLLMEPLGNYFPRGSEEKFFITWLHISIGMTVFMLVILRLIWKFINPKPDYPGTMPQWQKWTSSAVHSILYTAIILQPIAGMVMVRARGRDVNFFNLFSVPGFAEPNQAVREIAWFIHHDILGHALQLFVIFHILAALYHHFIVKDNVLKKMTWGA